MSFSWCVRPRVHLKSNANKRTLPLEIIYFTTCLGDCLPPADLGHDGLEPPELELPGEPLVLLDDPLAQEPDVAAPRHLLEVWSFIRLG